MKILNHRSKKYDTQLYDSATNKPLKTTKAVRLEVEDGAGGTNGLVLLYTEAKRGPIVQLVNGGATIHYFLREIDQEAHRESSLDHWTAWTDIPKVRLIELCKEHAP